MMVGYLYISVIVRIYPNFIDRTIQHLSDMLVLFFNQALDVGMHAHTHTHSDKTVS